MPVRFKSIVYIYLYATTDHINNNNNNNNNDRRIPNKIKINTEFCRLNLLMLIYFACIFDDDTPSV